MFLGVSDNPVMCAWASIRPGISVLPPTSMTAASWTPTAFGDTETMRPSFTRTLNDRCGSANPSRRRLALVNSVWGIRNLSQTILHDSTFPTFHHLGARNGPEMGTLALARIVRRLATTWKEWSAGTG